MHACPTPDQLDQFRSGAILPQAQLETIAEHLAVCTPCSTHFHRSFTSHSQLSPAEHSASPANVPASATDELTDCELENDYWPPPKFLDQHPQWEILELLGGGGMGAVYLAREREAPSRVVAIKILRSGIAKKRVLLERFRREIEIMKTVGEHANLVSVVDSQELVGEPLLVTEYVEGRSLAEVLRGSESGRIEWQQAVDLILQVLLGLDFVWREHHLVHRDIKPSNLMLTPTGIVKILDFGLAKLREVNQIDSLTVSAVSAGTPAYCSPEQDDDFKHAGFQADLYSVGCTLYEMISGSKVFGTETGHITPLAVRMAHHQQTPRRLSKLVAGLPKELDRHILRLLEKQPERRFGSYREVIQALSPYASSTGLRRVRQCSPSYLESTAKVYRGRGSQLLQPLFQAFRRPYRAATWGFGVVTILMVCSWFLLLPASGQLRIVVDSPDVIVVVNGEELDGQAVKVEPRGEVFELTLKLPAGVSEIEVRQGMQDWQTQRVRITSKAVTQIRFQFGRPDEPAAVIADSVKGLSPAANSEQARMARLLRHSGRWAIEEDVLCHYDGDGEQWLVFGDPSWTDYDYTFEARHLGFPSGFSALFRSPQDDNVMLFSFGWIDLYTAQIRKRVGDDFFVQMPPPDGPYFKRLNWKVQADQWYSVKVTVRGQRADCYVDDVLIFTVTRVPYDQGRVGIRMWREWSGKSEFRNFKVVEPAGKVIWSGLPVLPEAAF
ncbi:protein kinase domain-containing protein [Planctomycetaceae bacterium SH139]